jgi:hypothetical protein
MEEVSPMTWQEILNGGADYIAEHGHAKGIFVTYDGCACAIGAMRMTAFGSADIPYSGGYDTLDEYRDAIRNLGSGIMNSIPQWNDAPERTAQEVIDTMRRVACG